MATEILDEVQAADTDFSELDYVKTWRVDTVNGNIDNINVNSRISIYRPRYNTQKGPFRCIVNEDSGTGDQPYCDTPACRVDWEKIGFTYQPATRTVHGAPGGRAGYFRLVKISSDQSEIRWTFLDDDDGSHGPGGSWYGKED